MSFLTRPQESDGKAADGFVADGYRKVFKGGYVRFNKNIFRDERLKDHEGRYVFVCLGNYTGNSLEIYPNEAWHRTDKFLVECE